MNLYDACTYGRIDLLEQLKRDGLLPDLMVDQDRDGRYPHEVAICSGQLNVLRWLVQDSGQIVDLTIDNYSAVEQAVAWEQLETLKWLVLESKQPVLIKINSKDTDWYMSDDVYNPAIVSFLEAVNQLHVAGVSIARLQQSPCMVQLVADGRFSPELISRLDASDLELAAGLRTTQSRKHLHRC